jgi:hypothetical protein
VLRWLKVVARREAARNNICSTSWIWAFVVASNVAVAVGIRIIDIRIRMILMYSLTLQVLISSY